MKITCAQVYAVRGISFADALAHPAYAYTKRQEHHNLDGSVDVEEAVFFSVSDSPSGRLWATSRYTRRPRFQP
jgi:hypothetical protein